MDGWETRRRRQPGHDWAIVRLGVPGVIHGVVLDTSWFTGNYPPECSVEAAFVDPLARPAAGVELVDLVDWEEIVPRSAVAGDTENAFDVHDDRLATHVRLGIYPDGGVARLRVHGEPVGDPRWVAGRPFDLAAMEHGGRVVDCSNRFYSSPDNLLAPGPARVMGEGWETSRRRDAGNDWVVVELATEGIVGQVEIDTTCFIGNAPGEAALTAPDEPGGVLLPRTRVQRDSVNRFLLDAARPVRRLRLDIHPDGGLARLRAIGAPTAAGRAALFLRWYDRLADAAAVAVTTGWGGADETWAEALAAGRPYITGERLHAAVPDLPGQAPQLATWSALTGSG